jgi:hypothetical protein
LEFGLITPLGELAWPGLGMSIDRVEDALVHAPPSTGVRFSVGDDNVNGGKSVDCKRAGAFCGAGEWKFVGGWLPCREGELRVLLMA